MSPDWHKIGIVSKNDYDRLEEKVDILISNQGLILDNISSLEKVVSKALKTQTSATTAVKKSVEEIRTTDLKMISKEIERVEELVKISLVNNLINDIENR